MTLLLQLLVSFFLSVAVVVYASIYLCAQAALVKHMASWVMAFLVTKVRATVAPPPVQQVTREAVQPPKKQRPVPSPKEKEPVPSPREQQPVPPKGRKEKKPVPSPKEQQPVPPKGPKEKKPVPSTRVPKEKKPVISPKEQQPVLSPKEQQPVPSPKEQQPVPPKGPKEKKSVPSTRVPKEKKPVLSPKEQQPVPSPKEQQPVPSPKEQQPVPPKGPKEKKPVPSTRVPKERQPVPSPKERQPVPSPKGPKEKKPVPPKEKKPVPSTRVPKEKKPVPSPKDRKPVPSRQRRWTEWMEVPLAEHEYLKSNVPSIQDYYKVNITFPGDDKNYIVVTGDREPVTHACLDIQQELKLYQPTEVDLFSLVSNVSYRDRPSRLWPSGHVLDMLSVDEKLHSRIIGRAGNTVDGIRKKHCVDIYIPNKREEYKDIHVLGWGRDVDRAVAHIHRLIRPRVNRHQYNNLQRPSTTSHNGDNQVGRPKSDDQFQNEAERQESKGELHGEP